MLRLSIPQVVNRLPSFCIPGQLQISPPVYGHTLCRAANRDRSFPITHRHIQLLVSEKWATSSPAPLSGGSVVSGRVKGTAAGAFAVERRDLDVLMAQPLHRAIW